MDERDYKAMNATENKLFEPNKNKKHSKNTQQTNTIFRKLFGITGKTF